jgi:hypothetical protein
MPPSRENTPVRLEECGASARIDDAAPIAVCAGKACYRRTQRISPQNVVFHIDPAIAIEVTGQGAKLVSTDIECSARRPRQTG